MLTLRIAYAYAREWLRWRCAGLTRRPRDDLSTARGIIIAVLLSAPVWLLIAVLWW